jgi:hypothetical protein
MYENSDHFSHRARCVSIAKIGYLMLPTEKIAAYSEKHIMPLSTLHEQNIKPSSAHCNCAVKSWTFNDSVGSSCAGHRYAYEF